MKRNKLITFIIISYVIFIPIINAFMKMLEKSFLINLNTVDISLLDLPFILFKNGFIVLIWVIIDLFIILLIKNIETTRKNLKIDVEGINLKNKDGTYGTADWASEDEIKKFMSIGKEMGL